MKSYEELLNLINTGKLELLYVISPPRTLSHAIEIYLAGWGDGQINEPFHMRKNGIDHNGNFVNGFDHILKRYLQLDQLHKQEKIQLVVKDLSKHLAPETFAQITNLCNKFVITIREPTNAIYSLIKRRANDYVQFGGNELNDKQVFELSNKLKYMDVDDKSYDTLIPQINRIKSCGGKLAILSGITFRSRPAYFGTKLVQKMKLGTTHKQLKQNWPKNSGTNFFNVEFIDKSMYETYNIKPSIWITPAINSKYFSKMSNKLDHPIDFSYFRDDFQNFLYNKIIPTFTKMFNDENNITTYDQATYFDQEFIKSRLYKTNIFEAYYHILRLIKNKSSNLNDKILTEYLNQVIKEISKKYPGMAKAYINNLKHI